MKRRPPTFADRRTKRRVSQRHTCFCGRTLHNDQDWQEHKRKCPSWNHTQEPQA